MSWMGGLISIDFICPPACPPDQPPTSTVTVTVAVTMTVEVRLFLFIWTTCAGAGEIEMVCPIDGEYKLDPDNVRSTRPDHQGQASEGAARYADR